MISIQALMFIAMTVGVFGVSHFLQVRFRHPLLNPVLISILTICGILVYMDIPFHEYREGGDYLTDLLGIAVVALGVPLYQQAKDIRRELPGVLLIITLSSSFALANTIFLATMAGASSDVALSLAPKSVTTPIAVMITTSLDGIPALSAIAVIFTGIMGAVFGIPLLSLMRITSPKARGIAMGAASHAIGTARITQSSLQEGAYSALALVLSASMSALLAPIVIPAVLGWLA
ncbi:LrgB family protein [Endozoicomonas sp. OPT23]|uniref:LrgB family protein n=1 Tax=Endozoicomonas sp. OPT23 TaxID=2072845 RepID=UPI00189178D9|nr:LrgB family protein [Endozoicomonas sp. OPT23]